MEKQSVIKVSGAAMLKVAPDYNSIKIEVKREFPTNDEAYEAAKQNSLAVIAALESVGLDGSLAKTARFDISERKEPIYKNGHIVGYEKVEYILNQTFVIELPTDNVRINEICVAITESMPDAEIKLHSFLSNPHAYKMEVLSIAVMDAREKAEVIATTLGCTLGEILEIEYRDGDTNMRKIFYCPSINDEPNYIIRTQSKTPLSMTGEDQTISDSVMVTWQLVNPR